MLKLNKRFVLDIISVQDFMDPQEYKNSNVRWSFNSGYTFAEQIESDLRRYRSQSAYFEQRMQQRKLQTLTNICLSKIPPISRESIPACLHRQHSRLWRRATSCKNFETKGKYACEFASLFYPKRYPDAFLDAYYAYNAQKVLEKIDHKWKQIFDFLRVGSNALYLGKYGLVNSDRHGLDYTLLGTIHGKHYAINVDIATKQCDVCVFGESPTWLHVKKLARNSYIDLFPELEWIPRHQLLNPRTMMQNPYI